jgi:uncharacterized membrane protein
MGSVMAWFGGGVLFVSVISPGLKEISQGARTETLVSVLPRYSSYLGFSSGLAILAGIAVYGYSFVTTKSSTPFESGTIYIDSGAAAGLVAFVIVMAVIIPASKRIVAACKQPQVSSGQELKNSAPNLIQKMRAGAMVTVSILALALILMIIGASI